MQLNYCLFNVDLFEEQVFIFQQQQVKEHVVLTQVFKVRNIDLHHSHYI